MPGIFRIPPLLTSQVRRPTPEQLMSFISGVVNTDFTASASFQATLDANFTASASFATVVDTAFTASASFATLVDTAFTAASSWQATVDKTFTASASFNDWKTTFTASASFSATAVVGVGFTASASFVQLDTTIAATYWPYPESTEVQYEVRVIGRSGTYTDVLDKEFDMNYTLVANDVGTLTLTVPATYPLVHSIPDTRYEVWRRVGYGQMKLEGNTQFIAQERARICERDGSKRVEIVAPTINSVLKRRVVAYNDGLDTYSEWVAYSENIMKQVAYSNMMLGATDSTRRIDSSVLYTQGASTSMTSIVGMQYAHKNVLDVIKDLANQSFQLGYPLYYDIIATTPPTGLIFTTMKVRGNDRRYTTGNSQLILGHEFGNIGAYSIREIYTDEITFVYCAGPGEDDVREVVTVEDAARSARSVFGRRELWEDYQDGDTTAKLTSRANALLGANRPKKIFEGEIISTKGALYGQHWGFGDLVTAAADGENFDSTIMSVQVSVHDKDEDITASIRSIE